LVHGYWYWNRAAEAAGVAASARPELVLRLRSLPVSVSDRFRHSFSSRIKPIGSAKCSLIRDGVCRPFATGARWNAPMLDRSPQEDDSRKRLLVRLDRLAGEMNAFL